MQTVSTSLQRDRAERAERAAVISRATPQWLIDHPAEAEWLNANRDTSDFAHSLVAAVYRWGSLTVNQHAAIQRILARANRPEVLISLAPVESAFARAKQAGIQRPKLRLDTFTFSPAPLHGKNPNAVYIKEDGLYLGKVAGGKLFTLSSVPAETEQRILAVAADPEAAAIAYGKRFGKCSVCARDLTDADSIARGIGPVCATKFGWKS
jgi:hypothetical protein